MVSLSLQMNEFWIHPPLVLMLCEIIKYLHSLNHLKLSFFLSAAKNIMMILKKSCLLQYENST